MNGTPAPQSAVSDTPANVDEFVTVKEAMAALRLSKAEIYRRLASGDLTGSYYGRKRLVDAASVKNFASRIRSGEFAAPIKVGAAA